MAQYRGYWRDGDLVKINRLCQAISEAPNGGHGGRIQAQAGCLLAQVRLSQASETGERWLPAP
jgi:hypothetical protein